MFAKLPNNRNHYVLHRDVRNVGCKVIVTVQGGYSWLTDKTKKLEEETTAISQTKFGTYREINREGSQSRAVK